MKKTDLYFLGLQDSGNRSDLGGTGGLRDIQKGNGRFDLLPFEVIWRLAKHYEAGAGKYGDRNWENGIPAHSFVDSAMRHISKYMMGWNDEDHLIAAIWNLCGLAWTEEKHPELIDIPNRQNTIKSPNDETIDSAIKEDIDLVEYEKNMLVITYINCMDKCIFESAKIIKEDYVKKYGKADWDQHYETEERKNILLSIYKDCIDRQCLNAAKIVEDRYIQEFGEADWINRHSIATKDTNATD